MFFDLMTGTFKPSRFNPFLMRGLFNDGGGSGGGGGTGSGDGGSGSGDGSGNDGGDGKGGGDKGGKGNDPYISFPDESSFMRRVNQASRQELEKMAKELGFENADALKEAAKAKKEADEAAKSELEKEKARAEQAEKEKKAALEAANTRLINAEIKVFAAQAGFVDPADAVALVDRSSLEVDDKGNVNGAKEAVDALAKAKPHLVGTGKPGGSPGNPGNPGRQDGGDGNKGGDFGKKLAEKRAAEAKKRSETQVNYFK